MPVFAYRGVTPGRGSTHGVIDADSARSAWQALRTRGIYPTTIASESAAERRVLPAAELADVTRRLATLLAAGLPLTDALATAAEASRAPTARTLTTIAGRVREGASLTDALATGGLVVPAAYRAALRAGESRGDLPGALARAADHVETAVARRRRLVGALTYPAIVVATSGAVVVFLLVWVLPQIRTLLDGTTGRLPGATRVALAAGDLLAATWWLPAIGAAAVAVAWRRAAHRGDAGWWLSRAAALPITGPLLRAAAAARAAHALGTLLEAGLPLDAALPLAAEAAGPILAPAFEVARARVHEGRPLSAALGEAGDAVPTVLVRLVATGERAGRLGESFSDAARVLDDDVARGVDRLVTWLEPALVVATGAIVLAVVVLVLLPILSLDPAGVR